MVHIVSKKTLTYLEQEAPQKHYWIEARKDMHRILFKDWDTMLLIHNSSEFKDIAEFVNFLPYVNKLLYISVTKTFGSIKDYLRDPYFKRPINFYFIDCISSGIFNEGNIKGCYFEETPSNFEELAKMIEKYLVETKPDIVIIDSLSKFIDFSSLTDNKKLLRFLTYVKSLCSGNYRRFILLYGNRNLKKLIKLPLSHVDITFKIEKEEESINWR